MPKIKYKKLGKTNRKVSICGFGGYRIDSRIKNHEEALKYALESGINLVDTSTNYADGESEILIGKVLKKLGKSKREKITVVSKVGYIQGSNLEEAKKKDYAEVVNCSPDLRHCIHPDFIKDQLDKSLKRLEQKYIDVYLLHNPEYFLNYTFGMELDELRKEYYRRIKKAFEYLESEVKKGRIKYYGVSSNTFVESSDKQNFTSLEKLLEVAKEVSTKNKFAVVQAPLNILEKGAFNNKNQSDRTSFLEKAYKSNLGVLANRPLNAIKNNRLKRLADFEIKEDRSEEEVKKLIEQLKNLEKEIRENFLGRVKKDEKKVVNQYMSIGKILDTNLGNIQGASHFGEIRKMYLVPRVNYAITQIYDANEGDHTVRTKLNKYATQVNITLNSIESIFAKKANEENKEFHEKLDQFIPAKNQSLPLSQKAVMMNNSLKEVTSTLVGMRSIQYVDDALNSMKPEYFKKAVEFWKTNN
jgi:hypothetical protein